MDGFIDLEEAIKAESKSRLEKVEKLAGLSCACFTQCGDLVSMANPEIWHVRKLAEL